MAQLLVKFVSKFSLAFPYWGDYINVTGTGYK